MRAVDRGVVKPPAELERKDKDGKTELERAEEHYADRAKKDDSFPFDAYRNDRVKALLHQLFHGKCAYCETFYSANAPMDVEHYRPKAAVKEDLAHRGYWWLAMRWDNLLPSCIDCNRKRKQVQAVANDSLEALQQQQNANRGRVHSGKQDSFPLPAHGVRANAKNDDLALERPLLLDPTRDEPSLHLGFYVDPAPSIGLALPRTHGGSAERGAVSIQTYGLNRLGLVQDRTRTLRQLEFLGDTVIELSAMIEELEDPVHAAAFAGTPVPSVAQRLRQLQQSHIDRMRAMAEPQAPYSAMAGTWLKEFAQRLA
ncbi:hypothetical protein K4L06_16745 [Lysobacter sp. BMK333-48F3]|uniref:HNH endonuclease n=1 Tax=Lysobacter sp. BMK333-48F3 TaxID=2867962 RepID=UPI001C8CCAFE|nr:hypothetical protein [Lysobacter sp. BMK333-48F3]MBX9402960.1 hypothetical protein [Lysobacter sp. BMK333-48F3]